MAVEGAQLGITVNGISPGYIATPLTHLTHHSPIARHRSAARKRPGPQHDIGGTEDHESRTHK